MLISGRSTIREVYIVTEPHQRLTEEVSEEITRPGEEAAESGHQGAQSRAQRGHRAGQRGSTEPGTEGAQSPTQRGHRAGHRGGTEPGTEGAPSRTERGHRAGHRGGTERGVRGCSMSTTEAKDYLTERHIPRLFESLLSGLMFYRPEDPISYIELCLQKVRDLGGPEKVQWDTFLTRTLPPINGGQGKKTQHKAEGLPAQQMRRYDRLPPIQSQFSIDSDSDMTESSGLIQEYDVFDPNRERPKIIFVIGGPGSGKGTQSTKMASHFGFVCVSVGEILRKQLIHHATSDRKWELIAQIISKGELAPPETTIEELKQQFINQQDSQGFVVDGFPRDIGQAFTFEEQIGTPDLVIFLACSSQRLRQRLERRSAQQGRPDDNAHAIDRRLETFKQNLPLIVKYYQDKGLIARFDADREENDIFEDICCAVQGLLFPDGLRAQDLARKTSGASCSEDHREEQRRMEVTEQVFVFLI
ncbi:adenylate kinase isoenzyme 5-like [Discoglossus pictus]